jgi:arginine repressor
VQREEGNEGCQEHHHEKWQTRISRHMPELWHQDVPNRKEQLVYKKKDEGRKVLSSALIF